MRKKIVLFLSLILFLGVAMSCATGREMLPFPSDVKIVLPAVGLPAEIAAFSGEWTMMWDGPLNAILIVEEIDSEKAKITYSWGDCGAYNIRKGFFRGTAKVIVGSKVRIEWGDGSKIPKFTFEMRKDLKSSYVIREFKGRGVTTVAAKKID